MTTTLTPTSGQDRLGGARRLAASLAGFGTEVRKNLLTYAAGWRATAVQLLMFPSFSMLIALGIGRGQFRDDLLVLTVIGLVSYVFAHEQLNRAFWIYLGDIQAGVLEQTYLTPLPSWALLLGR